MTVVGPRSKLASERWADLMANEQLLRDFFELGNLGLQIYNPEAYKVIQKLDQLSSSRHISDRAGNAVAGFSLGARVFAGLQVFDNSTKLK